VTCILGIDPGSRVTGYGVIEHDRGRSRHLASGAIRLEGEDLGARLATIFEQLQAVIGEHRPDAMAVEEVFVSHNVSAALKLGQARGAAICAGAASGLSLSEYAPRTIKQALVGTGRADKAQVQHMVRALLGLRQTLAADAADALAVAICCAHLSASPVARHRQGGRR